MGAAWGSSAIVLVIFRWGGIVVGNIHRNKLFGLGEELHLLSKLIGINCEDLVHMLELGDVYQEF